jgi:hypothetical protein
MLPQIRFFLFANVQLKPKGDDPVGSNSTTSEGNCSRIATVTSDEKAYKHAPQALGSVTQSRSDYVTRFQRFAVVQPIVVLFASDPTTLKRSVRGA